MVGVLHAVKMIGRSNEEWMVPIEELRLAVQRAVREVAKSPEHVEVKDVEIIAKSESAVEIKLRMVTSILVLAIGDLDEEARAALGMERRA